MVLILGARYAGKRDAARNFYPVQEFCDGQTAAYAALLNAEAVTNYHLLIRRLLTDGKSPEDFTNRFISANPDALVIMDEVGAGIVPMQREERVWREKCGICSRIIAENSRCVIRVICGIPQVLKGELP